VEGDVSVLASTHGLAASSGVVAAWVLTALILLLLAAVLWSFVRRSGTVRALEVDRLDQRPPQERIDDAPAADLPGDDGPDAGTSSDGRQG
jgi:hypothetical protein